MQQLVRTCSSSCPLVPCVPCSLADLSCAHDISAIGSNWPRAKSPPARRKYPLNQRHHYEVEAPLRCPRRGHGLSLHQKSSWCQRPLLQARRQHLHFSRVHDQKRQVRWMPLCSPPNSAEAHAECAARFAGAGTAGGRRQDCVLSMCECCGHSFVRTLQYVDLLPGLPVDVAEESEKVA